MKTRCAVMYSVLISLFAFLVRPAWAQDPFQVDLNQDGDTIGEMRPVFLQFEAQAMPAISPREVARRYQRLFDRSEEPEVRIDALNRLANLQDLAEDDIGYSADQEQRVYQEILVSYDQVLERGAFKGRLDELLYQMAKAHAYVGQGDQSTSRLKQLIGLYPRSPLVSEARFRVAESAYAAGDYREAESMYREVLAGDASGTSEELRAKARYMLGWSEYKQDKVGPAGETFLAVLDSYREETRDFRRIPSAMVDLIDDTFRVIALIAIQQGGERYLESLLGGSDNRGYSDLLYDRLADLYVARREPHRSVAVSKAFIEQEPAHSSVPAMRAQIVDVLASSGDDRAARQARAEYVAAYSTPEAYQGLEADDQARWRDYSHRLADFYYAQASGDIVGGDRIDSFTKAAGYYEGLAERSDDPGPVHRLTADAWLQANHFGAAIEFFNRAAYQSQQYSGAADAAWAALTLQVQALDGEIALAQASSDYAEAAERFIEAFPQDARGSGLMADLANRMVADGNYPEAERFADGSLAHEAITTIERFSVWLALGSVYLETARPAPAENAWRKSLELAQTEPTLKVDGPQIEQIREQLGTSIYRQGEQAEETGDTDLAVAHYQRIEAIAPGTELAIRARFDAANTLLRAGRWQPAVNELKRFRTDFSGHVLTERISNKLIHAYQQSDQPNRAGEELLATAERAAEPWPLRLQAAELFHQGGDTDARNNLYRSYLALGGSPATAEDHLIQQRMRHRLIDSGIEVARLRQALVQRELDSPWHSEESLNWAATAALALGLNAEQDFNSIPLNHPLAQSLSRKQSALDQARQYYRQAGRLGGATLQSEALFRHAELYRTLARDLMNSSRPEGLTALESAQYEMLLEEQAYPFEELAIELHAQNHRLLEDGHYDQWVEHSLDILAELFPGRYARELHWMNWQEEGMDGV